MKYLAALLLLTANLPAQKNVDFTGALREVLERSLTIQIADSRLMMFKITAATKFNDGLVLTRLSPGERVRVQGVQDSESFLIATVVSKDQSTPETAPGAASDVAATSPAPTPTPENTVVRKPAARDADDDGPPVLKRGIPIARKAAALPPPDTAPADTSLKGVRDRPTEESAVSLASVSRASNLSPKEELIERAREWALNFTGTLPNYVCQQYTTRYIRLPGNKEWQAKDVVSANVVYENGKEDYRNIAINGKAVNKKMEEMPGSWSTGEFGTTLRSLLHPGRRAVFTFVKQSEMNKMTTWVYDYQVARENSDWHIQLGSQSIIPAYQGRVWIDQKSARVLRIEMSAVNIPEEFPLDQVEASNDYGFVRLASADEFLLPTHAETLSCERGSPVCSRNTIDFRNYHKYTGDANIVFK